MTTIPKSRSHGQNAKQQEVGQSGMWSPYFISSDAGETRHTVGLGICDHVLEHRSDKKQPVTIQYRNASLNKLSLHDMRYSTYDGEARIHVPKMPHIYLCEINLSGDCHVGQSRPDHLFQAGQICMINANQPHTKLWESDGHQLMIKVQQYDMEAAVERVIGQPLREPLIFSNEPQPSSGKLAILSRLVDLLSLDLSTDQSFFGEDRSDGSRSSIEDILIDLLLGAIPNNYSERLANPEALIRPRHIRHAANYIHLYAGERITLNDLVAAAGVSQRSLHEGFRKYYGVSPMTHLRNVRLDRARLALQNPRGAETNVTDVALECGFSHLSKFAQAYRARFGELPSETLRNT